MPEIETIALIVSVIDERYSNIKSCATLNWSISVSAENHGRYMYISINKLADLGVKNHPVVLHRIMIKT
jgi:hypothetical protein